MHTDEKPLRALVDKIGRGTQMIGEEFATLGIVHK